MFIFQKYHIFFLFYFVFINFFISNLQIHIFFKNKQFNKNVKNQRLKITAYIKTSELRSEGINVKIHIQNFKNNSWSETFTNRDLAVKIENNILNEARNLRINSNK